jgi:hypothetical protein
MLLKRGRRANHAPKVSKSEVLRVFKVKNGVFGRIKGEKWRFGTNLGVEMVFLTPKMVFLGVLWVKMAFLDDFAVIIDVLGAK